MSRKAREVRLQEADNGALKELLDEWVKELALGSWDISCQFVRRGALSGDLQMAQVDMDSNDELAIIRVVDPRDLAQMGSSYPGVEHLLVHELMHVVYRDVEKLIPDNDETLAELSERAVNRLERAFVSLKQRLRRSK